MPDTVEIHNLNKRNEIANKIFSVPTRSCRIDFDDF